jgi:hypothetical protein
MNQCFYSQPQTPEGKTLKETSYECIFDKKSPVSGRVGASIIYTVIRAGEIIDWWFPVKVSDPLKTQ